MQLTVSLERNNTIESQLRSDINKYKNSLFRERKLVVKNIVFLAIHQIMKKLF